MLGVDANGVRARSFRLVDMGRTVGVRRASWAVPWWTIRRDFIVLVCDLRGALPEPPVSSDVRWTTLAEADLTRVRTIDPALSEATVDRWHDEGRECTLGWLGDALAYVRWDAAASPYLPFLGRTLRLLDGDSHSAHAFTHPAFRRRGRRRRPSARAAVGAPARLHALDFPRRLVEHAGAGCGGARCPPKACRYHRLLEPGAAAALRRQRRSAARRVDGVLC